MMNGDDGSRPEIVRLLSVTSIISKGLGKNEGLLYWAAGEAATCALDSRAVIDAMLESSDRSDVWKWIRDARMRTMKRAQARGTQLHHAAEQLAKGVEPTLEPEVQPYFDQFRRWLETWNPTTLMAEATVYNPVERYAGTLDGIVELSGRRLLYDIKTTAHGPEKQSRPPFPEVALQLSAYAHATHVGILPAQREEVRQQRWYDFDPSASYEPMPEVDAALCVVVSPFDCFAKVVEIGEDTWAAFKFVREIARWTGAWVDSGALFGVELLAEREKVA